LLAEEKNTKIRVVNFWLLLSSCFNDWDFLYNNYFSLLSRFFLPDKSQAQPAGIILILLRKDKNFHNIAQPPTPLQLPLAPSF
jgi:hypothetical protein